MLRRIQPATRSSLLEVGDLRLDPRARTAAPAGTLLELTSRVFGVLLFLVEHRGRTDSREMLARDLWKESSRFKVIAVQIARLRRKMDDPFAEKMLHTIRSLGFSLREPQR